MPDNWGHVFSAYGLAGRAKGLAARGWRKGA